MLFYCYKAEVERRNMAFIQDDATKERVEKVGKWLHSTNCKPGLLLYSDGCGTGKTTMARAVCMMRLQERSKMEEITGNGKNFLTLLILQKKKKIGKSD